MTGRWARHTGFAVPPVAWALSTQLGQITPYLDCRGNFSWTAASCAVLAAVSIGGVTASRLAWTGLARSERFVANVGFLIALAFVFALSLQGAATMLLDACQR